MKYYIFVNNRQIGPMTLRQLQFYNVTPDTQVRDENTADWKALMYYPELMQVYGPNAGTPRACTPQSTYTPTPTTTTTTTTTYYPPRKSDNSWVIWLIAVVVGLPILGFLLYIIFFVFCIMLSAL